MTHTKTYLAQCHETVVWLLAIIDRNRNLKGTL